MRKYFDPEINIKMLDFEDIATESGITSKTAVQVATDALNNDENYEISDVLEMK